jgi:uncharacterized RDD family membrane protein YckC
MARWTGTWLQGPEVTLGELRNPDGFPGERLGLAREGVGSLASFSARLAAFGLDIVASALIAGLLNVWVQDPTPVQRQGAAIAVLTVEQLLLVALTGQTLGMRLLDLRVLRFKDTSRPPGMVWSAVRTLVLMLTFGLAGFFTKDGRGLHDLAAGSVVVRT